MEGKPPTPPEGWDSSGLGGSPGGTPVSPQPAFGSATRNPG
jgi:hypothetical protein